MRRSRVRYSELTSLLDVLFILIFASLVQASGLVERARRTPETAPRKRPTAAPTRPISPPPDGGVTGDAGVAQGQLVRQDARLLRRRAAQALVAASARSVVVGVQVSAAGRITQISVEAGGRTRLLTVDVPLLERVPDPNIGVTYLGHRSAALRVCTAVRRALGWRTLRDALVVLRPGKPLAEMQVALVEGLRADQHRCYREERGLAVIVAPDPSRK